MDFAQSICSTYPIIPSFPASFGILGEGWVALTMLSAMVSLLLLALGYIAAGLLRHQGLITYMKFELFQVLGTITFFIAMGMMVFGMCNFDMGFMDALYPPGEGHYAGLTMYQIAENYFGMLKSFGYLLYALLVITIEFINTLAKITWISNPMNVGMIDSPMEALGGINSLFFYMVGGFLTSFLLLWLQMKVLNYLAVASLYFFMPLGVFFRSFEPTRKFGGTLMGLTLSFVLFYPIIIVFNDYIMFEPMSSEAELLDEQADNLNDDYYSPSSPQEPTGEQYKEETPEIRREGFGGGASIGHSISNGMLILLRPIMKYFLAAVVLPVISFIVLVEIAKTMTKLMGEELDVSNLTRMI